VAEPPFSAEQMKKEDWLNEQEIKLLFKMFDSDNSGDLDVVEVLGGFSAMAKGTPEEKAEMVFRSIDLDNNGKLTKKEVLKVYI